MAKSSEQRWISMSGNGTSGREKSTCCTNHEQRQNKLPVVVIYTEVQYFSNPFIHLFACILLKKYMGANRRTEVTTAITANFYIGICKHSYGDQMVLGLHEQDGFPWVEVVAVQGTLLDHLVPRLAHPRQFTNGTSIISIPCLCCTLSGNKVQKRNDGNGIHNQCNWITLCRAFLRLDSLSTHMQIRRLPIGAYDNWSKGRAEVVHVPERSLQVQALESVGRTLVPEAPRHWSWEHTQATN